MKFETDRLILQSIFLSDLTRLFQYASDSLIQSRAVFSIDEIEYMIKDPYTYMITLKENFHPIGTISIMLKEQANTKIAYDEIEIGYWIGKPFWGKGLICEAIQVLVQYAFCELECNGIWCGYIEGNEQSRKAMEKCGFVYHHTEYNKENHLTHENQTEHYMYLKRSEYVLFTNSRNKRVYSK